ncbi:5' nucleotidase, NT5C type [Pontibacillus salipaludis]|uniref:5'(3')-deoxyribonucleotidase n=1 Tax=Pontibacillus salipaludis TaxID=1697394 RepID=A0ABQ1QGM2_9BACI|nr:5'-3'-deoxyribonucleotidase [Pontibacillus salipaludis]GGD25475.1 putative 5'(3')-deoxyribonucleotidase [Pontibacillus salipaludis]
MERIAVDMDDVIADPLSKHIEVFNERFNEDISIQDLQGKYLTEIRPNLQVEIMNILSEPNFFCDLEVMEDSQEVLKELSQFYEIFIVTAAMEIPTSFTSKYKWLKGNFSFLNKNNFVFCGDKSIVNADYLIDDNPKHFKRFKGKGILFNSPYNSSETGYYRVNSWKEIRNYFL